jgi:phage shock protein E
MIKYRVPKKIIYAFLVLLVAWQFKVVLAGAGDTEAARLAWPMIQNGALLVDVRSKEEFEQGHLDGAINIEWNKIDALIAAIGSNRQRQVVFYCRSGNRAGKSIIQLRSHGYTNIFNATGLEALRETKP